MPYVIHRVRKSGIRYTAMYTDENGRYKSAGTYDTQERAQAVAEQHERHVRLRLAETSPADKATITVRDFGVKFLREHAVEPNSKMTYAQLSARGFRSSPPSGILLKPRWPRRRSSLS